MSLKEKSLLSLVIASSIFVAFLASLLYFQNAKEALGSVNIGSEGRATTTDATWSTATTKCKDSLVDRKVLTNIVIAKTSNATLYVYDATTTGPHSDHATTTLVAFPLTTVGSYTFDFIATRGLCVVVDTSVGVASSSIVTRP